MPLVVTLTGANVHDSRVFEELFDLIGPVEGSSGRPRKRPAKRPADKGHDCPQCRRYPCRRGIAARISRCGVESGERPGRHKWVVEIV